MIKQYFSRIRKSPSTLPVKTYRFFRKKIIQNIYSRSLEKQAYTLTPQEVCKNLGTKQTLYDSVNHIMLYHHTLLKGKDISYATKILNKEYELLGSTYKLNNIEWNKDFLSGKVWEKKHYSKMQYDEPGTDKKIPWELSKFLHVTPLGLAYLKTKDRKYAKEFQNQVEEWIKENPYEIGINWITPMECAIRAINWINGYFFFRDALPKEFWEKVFTVLYLHGEFIQKNLEWSPKKENHYISDLVGIFFLGIFFKNTKKGQKWISFAQKKLEKEMQKQVSNDGVDYEASLNYHRLVTELFILMYILAERNSILFSETFKKRLENMCQFIMWYTSPTGKAPSIGDTDNGRVIDIWNKDTNDHRDILSVASVLFNRGDFKQHDFFHEELTLLISKEEYEKIEKDNSPLGPRRFTDYFIMRDENIFLMIHCGDIGREGFGGHGHNDQLSFVLSTNKNEDIVDPGTYTYTRHPEKRQFFRSTIAHSTPVINSKEQNIISQETPFVMEHRAHARCLVWNTENNPWTFIGTHKGHFPIKVTRKIQYDRKKKEIIIEDTTSQPTKIHLTLPLNPKVTTKKRGNAIIINNELEITGENITIEKTEFSYAYGQIEENKSIVFEKEGTVLTTHIRIL